MSLLRFVANQEKVRAAQTAPPNKTVEVFKTEEKGSDVNLAVELVNDAWSDAFDCAVIVSNDADLERAMRIVKQQRKKHILLFTPGAPKRQPLNVLKRWAHKQVDLLEADVAACQLPNPVEPGGLQKPTDW